MQAYQERVVTERDDLHDKILKLVVFTNGVVFPTLRRVEQIRLCKQVQYMTEYLDILNERILAFTE